MPSVEEVWKDPDFVGLPHTEKVKVMQTLDPDFASLPTGEQNKVVVSLTKGTNTVPQSAELDANGQPIIDVTADNGGMMSAAEALDKGLISGRQELNDAIAMSKKYDPENVPEWGREHPNLYGLYGATKGVLSAGVEGGAAALGTAGGAALGALSPVPGGAAVGGIAGGGAAFAAGKRLSQAIGLSDEPMDNSASGIGKDFAIGAAFGALPLAGKVIGAGIRAIPGGNTAMNLAGRTSLADLGAALGEKLGLTADNGVAQRVMQSARLADLNVPKLTSALDTEFTKAIRPSVTGNRTATQSAKYADNARTAVKEIVLNKDNLGLVDEAGQPLDVLPQNLQQFRQAIDSTKKAIWQKVEDINTAAGKAGAEVKLDSAVNELRDLANKPVYKTMSPETVSYAQKRADSLGKQGAFTVADAQDAITLANQSLKSFYQNPSAGTASKAYVDSLIANHLRANLDTALEQAAGTPAAAPLRQAYGAIKTIEKDVNNRATVDARKNVKGLVDFADIYTAGELVHALASANPALMAKTGTMAMVKGYIKRMNDPNTHVKRLFKIGDKLVSKVEFEPHGPAVQPTAVVRPQTVLDSEALPKVSNGNLGEVIDPTSYAREYGWEGKAPAAPEVANPEVLPPRQSSQMPVISDQGGRIVPHVESMTKRVPAGFNPEVIGMGTEDVQLGDRMAPKPRPLRGLADLAPQETPQTPKTDAHPWRQYVAENMGRAMKEEGSHGAAMKKLAQEWGKVKAKLTDERGLIGTDINNPVDYHTWQSENPVLSKKVEANIAQALHSAMLRNPFFEIGIKDADMDLAKGYMTKADYDNYYLGRVQEFLSDSELDVTSPSELAQMVAEGSEKLAGLDKKTRADLDAALRPFKNANVVSIADLHIPKDIFNKVKAKYKQSGPDILTSAHLIDSEDLKRVPKVVWDAVNGSTDLYAELAKTFDPREKVALKRASLTSYIIDKVKAEAKPRKP